MVKRYDAVERAPYAPTSADGHVWPAFLERSANGQVVLFTDFDRFRRRLIVKLCRERAEYKMAMFYRYLNLDCPDAAEQCSRTADWLICLAEQLENGEQLKLAIAGVRPEKPNSWGSK